jgi:hypothetical protein
MNTVTVFESRTQLVQGQKKSIVIKMLDDANQVLDLSTVVSVQAAFTNKLFQTFEKSSQDSVNPIQIDIGSGLITVTLAATETVNFKVAKSQSWWLQITFPDPVGKQVFKFENALDVIDAPQFSTL